MTEGEYPKPAKIVDRVERRPMQFTDEDFPSPLAAAERAVIEAAMARDTALADLDAHVARCRGCRTRAPHNLACDVVALQEVVSRTEATERAAVLRLRAAQAPPKAQA